MQDVLMAVHVLLGLGLIGLVLLQQGQGADAGAAFGSGSSQTVFGSSGAGSFLTRLTALLATGFFITSLTLAYFAVESSSGRSVTDRIPSDSVMEQPASGEVDPAESNVPALPE